MPQRSVRPEEDAWRALEPRRPAREYGFVRPDDELWITTIANTLTIGTFTAVPIGWIEILPLWGGPPVFRRIAQGNATANRTPDAGGPVRIDTTGWIVDGGVTFDNVTATAFKRGMLYSTLRVRRPASDRHWTTLAAGYLVGDRPNVPIGRIEDAGPGGGEGLLSWVALAADIAPVDVTRVLGTSNALRKIHGFVWYYNAAAVVATRTLRVSARNVGLALPTGMTSGANTSVWFTRAEMSLTTGEEGTIFHLGEYASDVDAGVITVANLNVEARGFFPYTATEDDLAELFFDVGAADATDRHSIYLLQEEWLKL